MQKNKLLLFVTLFFGISMMATICAGYAVAGTPHLALGSITNSDASVPSANDIQFTAYISTRTNDVLTQNSQGCSYDGTTYGVEVGNFTQPWTAEEVLVIEFVNLTALEAKTVEVILTNAGVDNTNVQLESIAPATLTITPVDPTVQVPNTQQFTAIATFAEVSGDQDVTNKVTWSSSDTDKGTISVTGLFTSVHAGSTDITAFLSSITSNSSTVTLTAGALATLTVSPDTATLTAGQTELFTVTGVDANGNATDIGNITWSVNGGIGAIDSTTGLFNATTVGTGAVIATSDIGGISDTTGDVIVTPGALVALTVSPDTATLTADDTQQFTATGVDADGNTADLGTITWSIAEGSGTIDATTGLFGSTTVGTGTVTATSSHGPADSTGNITVSHGVATKMTLNASKTTIASDTKGSATLTATILDQNNNVVTTDNSTVVTFTLTDGTYLSLSKLTDTAENGIAEVIVTSKAGTLANPPVTDGANITSAPVLTPPTADDPDVIFTIVNFSINVDAPATTFVDGTGVHLVTSGLTPSTATFSGIGSISGDYRWELNGVGEISSVTADSITYTAPSIIEGNSQTATLMLTSATDGALTDDIAITTYNPVSITSPASAAGIAIGDTTQGVTVIGGTGTYKFQSSNTDAATIDADGGGVTPVAVGICQIQVRDATYGDFATENGFYAVSPQIEIVDPITVDPATKSLNASDSQTFAASGGKAGGYIWTCDNADAGTIDATTGVFTAAAVTATQTATIIAKDGYDIEGTATVTVYSTLEIVDKPATPPTVLAGESSQISVAGGDDDYTWTVTGPVAVAGGAGATFTFNAPTAGAFAGKYTITVADGEGVTDFINIYVPLAFTPFSKNINGGDSFSLVVSGADVGAQITAGELIDSNGSVIPDERTDEYATIIPDPNIDAPFFDEKSEVVFTVTGPADLVELKMFRLRGTVEGDEGLTDSDLNIATSGLYRVLPVVNYSGIVQDENANVIEGANVQFKIGEEVKAEATTVAGTGGFEVTLLSPSMISAEYDVIVTLDGKLTVNLTTAGWSGERTGPITLIAQGSTITGSVGVDIADALVECTVNDIKYTAYSAADGSYTLPLPVLFDDLPEGTQVRASKAGFAAKSMDAAATINFNLQALTPVAGKVTIETDGGSFSSGICTVELQAGSVGEDSDVTVDADVAIGNDSDYTKYSVKLVEINITDPVSGNSVILTKPIKLTIDFDTTNVNPGDFKNGNIVIYHAPTADDLRHGRNLISVLPDEIVYEDHMNGKVCFWVKSLSVFGIGSSSSSSSADETSLSDSSNGSSCFIATAAYGSPFESHVKILRNFRDVYLLPNRIGHAFVDTYYKYSPKAAAFIADHESLRAVTRVVLMPVVGISYAALHTTTAQKMLITFLMVSFLAGGYLAVRRLKARKAVTV